MLLICSKILLYNFEVESLVLFMRKQSKIFMTKMFSLISISSFEMAISNISISFNMNNLPGEQLTPTNFQSKQRHLFYCYQGTKILQDKILQFIAQSCNTVHALMLLRHSQVHKIYHKRISIVGLPRTSFAQYFVTTGVCIEHSGK